MKYYYILLNTLISIIIISPFVISEDAKPLPIVYCEHMGYSVEINSENKPVCVFDNKTSCSTGDFYNKLCEQDKIKEIPIRTEGQTVYKELGEKCAEGLIPSQPEYLLDQPKCVKQTFFNAVIQWFRGLF